MADANSDIEVVVERLGARGDGIAGTPDGPLNVPLALPGERVRVGPGVKRGEGRAAELLDVIEPSADRIDPPCRHFGTCGGCSVQHLAEAAYRDWKREIVVAALERQGIEGSVVEPMVPTPPPAPLIRTLSPCRICPTSTSPCSASIAA